MLLDYLADRLDEADRRTLEAALQRDPALRQRLDELRATWQVLGEDRAASPQHDLFSAIAERLDDSAAPAVIGRIGPGWWMKAAAAVLVAATAGHLAGRSTWTTTDATTDTVVAVDDSDITDQLQLNLLASGPILSFSEELYTESTQSPSPENKEHPS